MTLHDHRKLLTQDNYSKINKIYADDFGKDRNNFDFIDQAIKLIWEKGLEKSHIYELFH